MENSFRLNVGEESYEGNPDTTSLYTFLGKTAVFGAEVDACSMDCVAMEIGEEEDESLYLLIFQHNPGYLALKNYLLLKQYPAFLNQRRVPDEIVQGYQRSLMSGWENEVGEGHEPAA